MLDTWLAYIQQGGFVMPPLMLGTMLLWFCLGWRIMTLQKGSHAELRTLITQHLQDPNSTPKRGLLPRAASLTAYAITQHPSQIRGQLDESFQEIEDEMARFSVVIKSLVAAAPLTGLLGTVAGMIETFDSLADQALFSQSGGIAGGISQALITTQMGLVIAIPGLILGRVLDRREGKIVEDLDRMKHIATSFDTTKVSP